MFAYGDRQLRAEMIDGEVWFNATDACRCIGLSQHRKAILALDADEKGLKVFHTLGGPQKMAIISRPGLFKLIARSSKPEATASKTRLRVAACRVHWHDPA